MRFLFFKVSVAIFRKQTTLPFCESGALNFSDYLPINLQNYEKAMVNRSNFYVHDIVFIFVDVFEGYGCIFYHFWQIFMSWEVNLKSLLKNSCFSTSTQVDRKVSIFNLEPGSQKCSTIWLQNEATTCLFSYYYQVFCMISRRPAMTNLTSALPISDTAYTFREPCAKHLALLLYFV